MPIAGYGGTAIVDIVPDNPCSFCVDCIDANQVTCDSDCGRCTPTTIRAVVGSITTVTTCTASGTNSFKLAGTTAVNRTIDLSQDETDRCKFEASVASDYTLTRYSDAACLTSTNVFTIDTIKYTLIRTSSTNWTYEVAGYDGATKRVSFVGTDAGSCTFNPMNITATASICNVVATATHPTRTAFGNTTNNAGIFGTLGSTTFTVCP